MSFAGHYTGNDKVDDHAGDGAGEQEDSSADAVDDGQHDAGRDEENHVLDGGRPESRVSDLTCLVSSEFLREVQALTIPAISKMYTT